MAENPKDSRKVVGGIREGTERERQASAAGTEEIRSKAEGLLEEVLRRENLMEALKRVREELLGETYVPQAVRRVEIPPTGR